MPSGIQPGPTPDGPRGAPGTSRGGRATLLGHDIGVKAKIYRHLDMEILVTTLEFVCNRKIVIGHGRLLGRRRRWDLLETFLVQSV